ncbi:MAG: hypothetical protein MMC23_000627 [Stictis urceolatum]|nr:hypothetical protein [Stictis urceolata]
MTQKSVLITGCSAGGIGSALAEAFHASGLRVFATARDKSKMVHLEALENVVLLELDVTKSSQIKATVESVRAATGGKLDYLVNNSGRNLFMPTFDINIDNAKRMFDTNL